MNAKTYSSAASMQFCLKNETNPRKIAPLSIERDLLKFTVFLPVLAMLLPVSSILPHFSTASAHFIPLFHF